MKKSQFLIPALLISVFTLTAKEEVTVSREANPNFKAQDVVLENPYLRVGITTGRGGIIREFKDKITGFDSAILTVREKLGGYAEQRLGGEPYNNGFNNAEVSLKFLKQTPEEVVLECSKRMTDEKHKYFDVEFQNIYTMKNDRASLGVCWKIINHRKTPVRVAPWVRNILKDYTGAKTMKECGAMTSGTSMATEFGATHRKKSHSDFFTFPARNWIAQVPDTDREKDSTILIVFEYDKVFQLYTVHSTFLHTVEYVFAPVTIPGGGSWSGEYVIAAAPPLRDVRFASPSAAADIVRKEDGTLELQIAPVRTVGKAKARLLDDAGKLIGEKDVVLEIGKLAKADFPATDAKVVEFQLIAPDGSDLMQDKSALGAGGKMTNTLATDVSTIAEQIGRSGNLAPWPRTMQPFRKIEPHVYADRPAGKGEGLEWFGANSLERVFQQDSASGEGRVVLDMEAAADEDESVQLPLRNTRKTKADGLSLRFTDLKSAAGKIIPASALKYYPIAYVETRQPSMYADYPVGYWPEVLMPDAEFSVDAGETRSVWIAVRTPRTAEAGDYAGTVEILEHGKKIGEADLKIHIFDFTIPEKPTYRTFLNLFLGGGAPATVKKYCEPTFAEVRDQIRDIVFALRMTPSGVLGSGIDYFKANHATSYCISSNPHWKNPQATEKKLAEAGVLDESFVYCWDEIGESIFPEFRKWTENWRKISKIKSLVVVYGHDAVKKLDGLVDIWCGTTATPEEIAEHRKRGEEFWHCNSTFIFTMEEQPFKGRSEMWDDFATGRTGGLLWGIAAWGGDPWLMPFGSGSNMCGVMLYPVKQGAAATTRLRNYADGVEDYEYLTILSKRTAEAKKSSRHPETVAEAEAFLKKIGNKITSEQELRTLRHDAAVLIEKLK